MAIDKEEIEKYIFDPENPKGCKIYNLFLNIAKEKNLVYIDSNYMTFAYKNIIFNENFYRKLWDKPDNFETLSFNRKIEIFKEKLSPKDYEQHIDSLDIEYDKSIYTKLFKSFFDFFIRVSPIHLSKISDKYPIEIIKLKLKGNLYQHTLISSKQYGSINYIKLETYHGHKILFTDNIKVLELGNEFYDISSVIITTIENKDRFIFNNNINQRVKPIFLKKIEDIDLLLNVLEQDLKQNNKKDIIKENIKTIDKINIKNFFSITDISLNNLKDKKEIYIVGENGDGKTLLLQAIAIGLKGKTKGAVVELLEKQTNYDIEVINSDNEPNKLNDNMFAYGSSRNNHCNAEEDETGFLTLFNSRTFNVTLKDAESWLIYLDHKENILLISMVKSILKKLLGDEVETHITPDEVTFTERGRKDVSFEQLSAGYRSVIIFICDLLDKLSNNQPYVSNTKEYEGIVLIDEVELHLHPKWKYNFMARLREFFPLIQFIVTTHSPTVILGASKEAVFYKIYKDEGEVNISSQMPNRGYTNNSLISSPLFDLDTIASRDYPKSDISDDNYVNDEIYKVIEERLKNDIDMSEEDVFQFINDELDKS